MKLLGIILLIAVLAAGAVWIGTKFFKLYKDTDGDGIPDKVEEKAAAVKTKARRVKKELKDVVKEVADVKDAVVGEKKPKRRGRPKKNK